MCVTPVAQHKGADRPSYIAYTIGRKRGHDCNGWIPSRKEQLGKDQRRGGRIDEEVIILKCRSDPAAGSRFPRLLTTMRVSGLSRCWHRRFSGSSFVKSL